MNWTRELTRELIKLYKQHPKLYNPNNVDFCDRTKRNDAIASIANDLQEMWPGITLNIIKGKIKTLRRQYLKEQMTIASSRKNGTSDIHRPKLWCYDQLEFLDTYITPSSPSHLKIAQSSISSSIDETVEERDVEEHDNESQSTDIFERENIVLEHQLTRSLQVAEEIAERMLTKKQKKDISNRTPQYNLGKIVETELSGLSAELFHEAKWKIMGIIQEAQRKNMLMGQNSIQCNGNASIPVDQVSPSNIRQEFKQESMSPQQSSIEETIIPMHLHSTSQLQSTIKHGMPKIFHVESLSRHKRQSNLPPLPTSTKRPRLAAQPPTITNETETREQYYSSTGEFDDY